MYKSLKSLIVCAGIFLICFFAPTLVLGVLRLPAALIATAQDTGPAGCDLEAAIADARDALDEAEALLDDDPEAALEALAEMRSALATAEAACMGLAFQGEAEDAVIGPVTIPAGMYRAVATTPGYLAVRITVIEGECRGSSAGSLFNLGRGDAADGAEALFTSEEGGCTALLELSNLTDAWQLAFERLK